MILRNLYRSVKHAKVGQLQQEVIDELNRLNGPQDCDRRLVFVSRQTILPLDMFTSTQPIELVGISFDKFLDNRDGTAYLLCVDESSVAFVGLDEEGPKLKAGA